jgi:peptide/nickel transport system substrate-binding protein
MHLLLIFVLFLLLSPVQLILGQGDWPANQPPDPWADVEGPRYGGIVRFGSTQEPIHLNPAISASGIVMAVANKIYEPLVRYGEDTVWAPELAHSWDSSPDGLKWTFHIYENATWHDGQPITSDDILFTYDTFVERHPTGVIFADVVDSVEAPDEYTFVMNFKYVHAGWRLNLPMLSIIPKHIFDVSGIDILDNEATRKPYVGSGAFKFVEWKAGEYIKLVRNDNFYQKKLPYLDEAYIIFAPDAQTLAAMFENGDIDDTTANGGGVPLADIALWRENPIAGKYPGTDGNLKYATTRFMLNCDPEYSKYTSQIKYTSYGLCIRL